MIIKNLDAMLSLEYCEQLVIWVRKNMKEAKMEDDAVVNKVLQVIGLFICLPVVQGNGPIWLILHAQCL